MTADEFVRRVSKAPALVWSLAEDYDWGYDETIANLQHFSDFHTLRGSPEDDLRGWKQQFYEFALEHVDTTDL